MKKSIKIAKVMRKKSKEKKIKRSLMRNRSKKTAR